MKKTRSWVPQEKIDEALASLEENRKWLEDKVVEQSKRALNLEPVMSIIDIDMRVKSTKELIFGLRKIAKPKAEKKSQNKTTTDDDSEPIKGGDVISV